MKSNLKLKHKQRGFIGSLISGAASLIGGSLANRQRAQQAANANQLSQASSALQMQFQERMSNTAHQREVKDLRAAGLNPILSSKYGGASTPSGASYTGQKAEVADVVTPAAQAYWSAKSVQAQVKNTEAQTENLGIDSQQKQQDLRHGEYKIERLQNLTIKERQELLYIMPERINQAKQATIQSKIGTAIKQMMRSRIAIGNGLHG